MGSLPAGQTGTGGGRGGEPTQSQGPKNVCVFCLYAPLSGVTRLWSASLQVGVQCEQLSRELAQQRERGAQTLQERLSEARDEGRSEARKQREELAHTVNITVCLHPLVGAFIRPQGLWVTAYQPRTPCFQIQMSNITYFAKM